MTTFKEIYDGAVSYRNGFNQVAIDLELLIKELNKHSELVKIYRRIKGLIKHQIDPLIEITQVELALIAKASVSTEIKSTDLSELVKVRKKLIRSNRDRQLFKLNDQYNPRLKQAELATTYKQKLLEIENLLKLYQDFEQLDQFNTQLEEYAQKYDFFLGSKNSEIGYRTISIYTELKSTEDELNHELNKLDDYASLLAKKQAAEIEIKAKAKQQLTQLSAIFKHRPQELVDLEALQAKSEIIQRLNVQLGELKQALQNISDSRDFMASVDQLNVQIGDCNELAKALDNKIALIVKLPGTVNQAVVEQQYQLIKAEINRIKQLYPQKKFDTAMQVLIKIEHNISEHNQAGAFTNRLNELRKAANKGIVWMNHHEWQITGKNWSRTTGTHHKYRNVKPIAAPIEMI